MEGNIPPDTRLAQREGVGITGAMPMGQSAAWSTSGQIVAGHPESNGPFMTVGMRIHTFKLAYPGIIISSDNRTATWRGIDNVERSKACDTSGELIAFLEKTFGGVITGSDPKEIRQVSAKQKGHHGNGQVERLA